MLFFTMRENVQFLVAIMLVLFYVNHAFHWSRYVCAMFVLVHQRSQYYLKSEQNLNMRQNSEDLTLSVSVAPTFTQLLVTCTSSHLIDSWTGVESSKALWTSRYWDVWKNIA